MHKLIKFTFAFFLGITILSASSQLQAMTFYTVESEPYWSSTLPNQGFMASVVRESMKRAGYTMELRYVPFARALYEAERGINCAGIFGFYHAKEREAFFLYSEPLINVEIVFLALKSRHLSYKSLRDLTHYTIGVLNGANNGPEFNAATYLKTETAQNKDIQIKKLLTGRVDLIVEIKEVAFSILAKENSANLVEVVGKPLQVKPLYIGFTKKNNESKKYKADFDKAFLSLKADGTYNKIRAQYKLHTTPKK